MPESLPTVEAFCRNSLHHRRDSEGRPDRRADAPLLLSSIRNAHGHLPLRRHPYGLPPAVYRGRRDRGLQEIRATDHASSGHAHDVPQPRSL